MPTVMLSTPSQTVGPFFHDALPYEHGPLLVLPTSPGAITIGGTVHDGTGMPIPDALVEIWQADPAGVLGGHTGIFEPPGEGEFRGFGRCPTGPDGSYAFTTLKPGATPLVDRTPQAPHIAMSVFARGMLRRVATRVYFPDSDANDSDPLLVTLESDQRATLMAKQVSWGYRFDIHLQGDRETVFLDVFAR
jgi:protocatechuate 3,4-dioxygenase alpha subunit